MPLVQIDVQQGHSTAHRRAILDGVHAALVECFKIPDRDRIHVLREHAAENFDHPPGKSDHFTVVQIFAFAGRSREAKRDLFAAIVRNLQRAPGIDPPTCSSFCANRRGRIGASAAASRLPASTWASRSTSNRS